MGFALLHTPLFLSGPLRGPCEPGPSSPSHEDLRPSRHGVDTSKGRRPFADLRPAHSAASGLFDGWLFHCGVACVAPDLQWGWNCVPCRQRCAGRGRPMSSNMSWTRLAVAAFF